MNRQELKNRRTVLLGEADRIFKAADLGKRNLTVAEGRRDDEISAEIGNIDAQISRIDRQAGRQIGGGNGALTLGGNGGSFRSLGEQMLAVASASRPNAENDPRLVVAGPTGMSGGVSSDGGFLVQTDFSNELLQNTYDSGEIASRVRRIQVGPNANGLAINGVDENSRANGARWGGIQSYWTGEAQLKTPSQARFRRLKMELNKLTGLCYATDELLQDSTALGQWLEQAFQDEFTFKIEDAILNGTGIGQPLGIFNAGGAVTVSKEPSQASATIVAENILKMWTRMSPRMRKNAVWLINPDVEVQLFQLNIKIKNVAGSENVGGIAVPSVVFQPPGANGNQYAMLMGRPVIPVEYCAALGTAGDIALVDLSQYLAIDKGPAQFETSIHVRFIYDESCFRFVYRFNGQPIWTTPMTPYKGTSTQSAFVVLQSR